MKSRIPHSKPSGSSSSKPAASKSSKATSSKHPTLEPSQQEIHSETRIRTIHTKLASCGLPGTISEAELAAVANGAFLDILEFVCEHLRGRRGVAGSRSVIHAARKERARSRVKHPDDMLRSTSEKAASAFRAAEKSVCVYREQLEERMRGLQGSEEKEKELKNRISGKRKISLLLDVLEQRERLRTRRFEEVGKIIRELRTKVHSRSALPDIPPLPSLSTTKTTARYRTSHVRETLTSLHVHHLRVSRLLHPRHPNTGGSGASEDLLIQRLRRALGKHTKSAGEADGVVERLLDLARRKARTRVRMTCSEQKEEAGREELNEKTHHAGKKERELQDLLNRAVGLAFSSEHAIESISHFLRETAPMLRSSLKAEGVQTRGYVDVLRDHIQPSEDKREKGKEEFTVKVKSLLGMYGAAPEVLAKEVERILQRTHARASFLSSAGLPSPRPLPEEQQWMIAAHHSNEHAANEHAVKLLTRKIAKGEYGRGLGKQIENVLGEAKTLIDMPR
ncbi:hypothetical protein BDQ12DRAFT_713746 [Crucibulum laeve]|uniref:Uncharacterized protein n=1 Tax=Crucibulum laeve TaxID=68775 RepID=A0A5C3LX69_9AGAR|nr:hypothetical protein BDQ12DRAFT_713746 [Crucibulum laeve]